MEFAEGLFFKADKESIDNYNELKQNYAEIQFTDKEFPAVRNSISTNYVRFTNKCSKDANKFV